MVQRSLRSLTERMMVTGEIMGLPGVFQVLLPFYSNTTDLWSSIGAIDANQPGLSMISCE
jgi:hypothetical protein